MNLNKHYHLEGKHAFLGASQYHWIRYSDEKLEQRFLNAMAAKRGTDLHSLAAECIRLGVKLKSSQQTMDLYVNDSIGYRMTPEQILYYSDNAFGTADALGFRRNKLRIFDLKTGESPASVDQLLVYGALFCLEYKFKPFELEYDFRIYQSDEVVKYDVDPGDLVLIMDKIVNFDKRIDALRAEVM